jgi:hypothetical protein
LKTKRRDGERREREEEKEGRGERGERRKGEEKRRQQTALLNGLSAARA